MSMAALIQASRTVGETTSPALTTTPANGHHGCAQTARPPLTFGMGGHEVEIIERLATLEADGRNTKESLERLEIKQDHLDTKLDFHAQETAKALQEIKLGITARNSASAERSRNIAVAGGALGAAAAAIGGFIWINMKAVMAFFAAVLR